MTNKAKGATFRDFAIGDADTGRNRYSEINKTHVSGSAAEYPRQLDAQSPWASDPVGNEPLIDASDCGTTLGVALGELHEQPMREASAGVPPSPDRVDASSGGDGCRDASVTAPPRQRKRKQ